MLINIGQTTSLPPSREKERESESLAGILYVQIHLRAFANPAKIARNLRENKIKMDGHDARTADSKRQPGVLARADARFEWLIFFLLSSLPPLTPTDPPSPTVILRPLPALSPLSLYLSRGRDDQRFDGGHLAANYD